MWRGGVALLDECDMILHPLRSEMNFPIGLKQPLAMMEERVAVSQRLVDGLFAGASSVGGGDGGCDEQASEYDGVAANATLDRALREKLRAVIRDGYAAKTLQGRCGTPRMLLGCVFCISLENSA